MHLNTLKPAPFSKKKKIRVGRGWSSGVGKTCGKGVKGQTSRGKGKVAIGFEGGQMPFHRRIPKSGFTSRTGQFKAEVRLFQLNDIDAPQIDMLTLKEHKIVSADTQSVKIILNGNIDKAVVIKGILVTKGAKEAIEKAGGRIEA